MYMSMRFPGLKSKALTFSYDDGVRQDKRLVKLFDRYEVKGTFNVCTGVRGETATNEQIASGVGGMSKQEILELFGSASHEVALHTYSHPHLESLSKAAVTREIIAEKENIEKLFGKITRGAAYPYGTYNDDVVASLDACGIAYCRTVESSENFNIPTDWLRLKPTCHHNNPNLTDLANSFLAYRPNPVYTSRLFYVWGHSYEFDNDNNWELMEDFLKLVSGREDVWYATNIEIYDYVTAYRSLITSADGKIIHNPTDTEIFFICNDENFSIKAGQTIKI